MVAQMGLLGLAGWPFCTDMCISPFHLLPSWPAFCFAGFTHLPNHRLPCRYPLFVSRPLTQTMGISSNTPIRFTRTPPFDTFSGHWRVGCCLPTYLPAFPPRFPTYPCCLRTAAFRAPTSAHAYHPTATTDATLYL